MNIPPITPINYSGGEVTALLLVIGLTCVVSILGGMLAMGILAFLLRNFGAHDMEGYRRDED